MYVCKKKKGSDEISKINFNNVISELEVEEKLEEEFLRENKRNFNGFDIDNFNNLENPSDLGEENFFDNDNENINVDDDNLNVDDEDDLA